MEINSWRRKSLRELVEENKEWALWFAWVPVWTQSGQCLWAEIVERRAYLADDWDGHSFAWEYRKRKT